MFKQSFKNIISLRKKYTVAIVTLVLMLAFYLTAVNMFAGLRFRTDLKSLHISYLQSSFVPYESALPYFYYVLVIFGGILIFIITKYISNMRAKEYSIYLIIAGVKKSKLYSQIIFETIILFTFIGVLSFLTFAIIQYPLIKLVLGTTYADEIKYLYFYIDSHVYAQFAKTLLTLFVLFGLLHLRNFAKLSIKQLMIASKSNETKKNDLILKAKDFIVVTLLLILIFGLIFGYNQLILKSGGDLAFYMLPIFIIVGFIANILIFKYLIKIIFIIMIKKQSKYNGLNKYYYSLIISKSSTLSKILGSTASVIVVCISAIVMLSNFGGTDMKKAPMYFNSSVMKEKYDKEKYESFELKYKKTDKEVYIQRENFNKFIKDYSTNQKKYSRDFIGIKLHPGSEAKESKSRLYIQDDRIENDDTGTRISRAISDQMKTVLGLNDNKTQKKGTSFKLGGTQEEYEKEEKQFKKDINSKKIYLVDAKTYNNFKGTNDTAVELYIKDDSDKDKYLKMIRLKGVVSSYDNMKLIGKSFDGVKLIIYVIPFLGFTTQISTLLFKFINSGWDNFRFTKLFLNLGFTKSMVSKIYAKETFTIFFLPLFIGLFEAILVGLFLAPTLLSLIGAVGEVSNSSLYFGIGIFSALFILLGSLTYFQYKSISFKNR